MGYSHYRRINKEINLSSYAAATAALRVYLLRVRDTYPGLITGWDGERATEIECDEHINFNGVGRESCENFIWYKEHAVMVKEDRLAGVVFGGVIENSVFFSTKTRQRAYDEVVLGAMLLLKYYLKDELYIASDGGDGAFYSGACLLKKVFEKELAESLTHGGGQVLLGLSMGLTSPELYSRDVSDEEGE